MFEFRSDLFAPIEQNRRHSSATSRILRPEERKKNYGLKADARIGSYLFCVPKQPVGCDEPPCSIMASWHPTSLLLQPGTKRSPGNRLALALALYLLRHKTRRIDQCSGSVAQFHCPVTAPGAQFFTGIGTPTRPHVKG